MFVLLGFISASWILSLKRKFVVVKLDGSSHFRLIYVWIHDGLSVNSFGGIGSLSSIFATRPIGGWFSIRPSGVLVFLLCHQAGDEVGFIATATDRIAQQCYKPLVLFHKLLFGSKDISESRTSHEFQVIHLYIYTPYFNPILKSPYSI